MYNYKSIENPLLNHQVQTLEFEPDVCLHKKSCCCLKMRNYHFILLAVHSEMLISYPMGLFFILLCERRRNELRDKRKKKCNS